ncbi:MAG: carbohydrate binding domain-containing protein, partial [Phycisphaerae bacterium]|nr:carbohydrate binding domain-containing protein [Phycisphaerae bacterium]
MVNRISVLLVMTLLAAPAAGGEFVPFVIPADWSDDAEINFSSPPIAIDSPRVIARDGHFYRAGRDGKRVRVWGVNLCFGACFPTHADAKRVAKRLGAFGINSVRFHHMDYQNFPRGIWDSKDPMKLSPEALDRLDYFIDQLARKGIWSNINLHVSRTHSRYLKLPDPGAALQFDKIVDIFTPQLIEAQRKFARDLLTRTNKYRKAAYAADPAVAFVEITNEDSFFMWGGESKIRGLPAFYAKILADQYNAWLNKRYKTDRMLKGAWANGSEALGANVLPKDGAWSLEQHGGCKAAASLSASGVKIEISKADSTGWHIQFRLSGMTVVKGRYYTLTFRAKASKARDISLNVGQADKPWGNLGLQRTVKLSDEWKEFRAGFAATKSEDNARVVFQVGGSEVGVELADIKLRPGGRSGARSDESLTRRNVALFAESETSARTRDRMRFLAETEKAYFDSMRNFVRKDLKCEALVTGTIVFGPLGLWAQSDMDFIDAHAYWHHPHFPGRPWDPGNWTVNQTAMVNNPDRSPLFGLAASRLKGKPFTVSEYNHPAPNDAQAECVPMITAFGAAQDWDGIWLFAYSHSADAWDKQHFTSFFDIHTNPAKWGFVPAGTAIFREVGITPATGQITVGLGNLGKLIGHHRAHDRDMFALGKLTPTDALRHRIVMSFGDSTADKELGEFVIGWCTEGLFGVPSKLSAVQVIARNKQRHAQTVTALDGLPLARSNKILITLCGRCENTDMQFSKDRRTVGRNWGEAPVRIEAPKLPLAVPGKGYRCYALLPNGKRGTEVPVYGKGDEWVDPDPKYQTMWYLLTRAKK